MKKSIVFKPYDGMAGKVGDVVYSAYFPEGEKAAIPGKVVYTNEAQLIVDWGRPDSLTSFTRATAGKHLCYRAERFIVNGFEVPVPLEKDPGEGQVVYAAAPTIPEWHFTIAQAAMSLRALVIARGLAHSTAGAAIAHAKAMIGVDCPPLAQKFLDDAYGGLP